MRLITRDHRAADGTYSTATFSICGTYRYALTRVWSAKPALAYIMLNPSKADETSNDPTIARCEKRARQLGFGGITIANLFAFCATDPTDLKAADAPVGPANRDHVIAMAGKAGMVLAAWGVHGAHRNQDQVVQGWLESHDLFVLGLPKEGLPRHPLYVSYAARPKPWQANTDVAR